MTAPTADDLTAPARDELKPAGRAPLLARRGGLALWLPVLLLLLVSIVVVTILAVAAGRSLDRNAAAGARDKAAAMLRDELQRIGQEARDYAWWDDLRRYAVERRDLVWADGNIGGYVEKTFGFSSTLLVGADDRIIMAFEDGGLVEAPAARPVPADLVLLVAQARAAPMAESRQAEAVVARAGGLHLAGAAAVTAEHPTAAELVRRPRPVLIFTRRLDDAFLAGRASTFGLPGLRLAPPATDSADGGLTLRDPAGTAIGRLLWNRPAAGRELVETLLPALVMALAAVLLLLGFFFLQVRQAASEQDTISRALQRERELVAMKSRLVHMFHHELGTPLTTIRSATDLLGRYGERLSGQEQAAEIAAIQRQVLIIQGLLDDVLSAAGDDMPQARNQPEALQLEDFCTEVWGEAAGQSDATHRLDLHVDADCRVACLDPALLRTILVNLLANAMRYAPDGTTVRLEIDRCAAGIRLAVSDQGIGIPVPDLDQVVSPFHRGGNVGAIKGSGLGLTIVQRAVERLGGSLAIRSVEGAGTRVSVQIPAPGGSDG